MSSNTHFLFFSSRAVRVLLYLALISQLSVILINVLDVSLPESAVLAIEGEEHKPSEEKNLFDYLKDGEFLIAELSIVSFFSSETPSFFYSLISFSEGVNSLDFPPPEAV